MTDTATHSAPTPFPVRLAKPEWTFTCPGFGISGQYNLSHTLFHISVTPPVVSDVPPFKVSIPTPLPSMTWVCLPGSTTLLGLSRLQEIFVVSMDSMPSIRGWNSFFDRLRPWFQRIIEVDGFVTDIKETTVNEVNYCVQACGGICEEIDEAFIVLSCYKFISDEDGSSKSAASNNDYEKFLEGL